MIVFAEDDEARLKILNSRGRRGAITDDGQVPQDRGSFQHQPQPTSTTTSHMDTMNQFPAAGTMSAQNMTQKIQPDLHCKLNINKF